MSWYSDREPFDEWDDPYCERIRCEGGDSYEQCKRCLARVYGNAGDEEQEEPMSEKLKPCPFCGSTNIELRKGVIFNGAAHCMDCTADVVFDAVHLTIEGGDWREAVRAGWNRRTDQ